MEGAEPVVAAGYHGLIIRRCQEVAVVEVVLVDLVAWLFAKYLLRLSKLSLWSSDLEVTAAVAD